MTHPKTTQPDSGAQPATKRIVAIDNLRGFALLGILLMNIMSFSMPSAAYSNPTVYFGAGWYNQLTYAIVHIVADQKFMGLFSMLFGASVILFSNSQIAKGKKAIWRFYIRNIWLLVFGVLHFVFLWYGDVLMIYAICSFALFFLRKLAPRWQFALGLLIFFVPTMVMLYAQSAALGLDSAEQATLAAYWEPPRQEIDAEIDFYRGPYAEQVDYRFSDFDESDADSGNSADTLVELVWATDFFARAFGMMLIGMALYSWGVLSGKREAAYYQRMVGVGFAVGFPLAALGWLLNSYFGWDWSYSLFFGRIFNNIATPFIDAGYIGLVMLWQKSARWPQLSARLAAIGRTALTCYIAHSVIATTLFYGFGFGLFGRVNRPMQLAVVLLIWSVQLMIAPWWLARFRFGPLEWAWRCLTYFKWQPLRRVTQG